MKRRKGAPSLTERSNMAIAIGANLRPSESVDKILIKI